MFTVVIVGCVLLQLMCGMIEWVFNGMSTQKGQFVPAVGVGNRLRYNAYYLTVHNNYVTHFTVNIQLHKRDNQLSSSVIYVVSYAKNK